MKASSDRVAEEVGVVGTAACREFIYGRKL